MFKTDFLILKNYLKKNIYKILLYLLIIITVLFFVIKNLLNIEITDNKVKIYQDLYYFMMFLYMPLIYLSMEYIFRSEKINFLRYFSIKNSKLVNYLLFSFFIKSLLMYFLELIVISVFIFKDISFFYAVLTYITVYHLMFFSIAVFVYSYISVVIADDNYSSVRKGLSSGWTDERLAPFLFAPAVVFAVLNFANIIVAKLLEKSFFDYRYSLTSIIVTLLILFAFLIFKGKQILSLNLLKNYAIISEFKNLYADGSYIVEKTFFEERFITKLFPKLSFNIMKDFKILKRAFRLQSLFIYFSFIAFIILETATLTSNVKFIAYFLLYLTAYLPIHKFYYPPIELKYRSSIYSISNKDIFISKVISSFVYLLPLIIYTFIFSIYYRHFALLIFPVFFIIQTIIIYFLSNKMISGLILNTLMLTALFWFL